MPELDFRQIQVFLIDKETNTRRLMRGILTRLGIEKITEFNGVADVMGSFGTTMPDLLIVDADPPDGEGLRFVNALRHSISIANPFICVIATTWQPTQAMMVRFAASGADDLIVKPFSAKQVQDRIVNLIDGRRKFVVTSDYLGPDRRKSPREGQQIPLIEVPNTLALKAHGTMDRNHIGEWIDQAQRRINEQKVIRHGFQAAFLVEFALPGLRQSPPEKRAADHLMRLHPLLEDLMRRLDGSDLRGQAETYAKALLLTIDRFKVDMERPLEESSVLRRAAYGLAALTARRSDTPAVEQEVAAAVTAYRNRLEQMVQAKAALPPLAGLQGAGAQQGPADKPAG